MTTIVRRLAVGAALAALVLASVELIGGCDGGAPVAQGGSGSGAGGAASPTSTAAVTATAGPFVPGQAVPDEIPRTPPAPAHRDHSGQPETHYQEIEPPKDQAPARAPGRDGIVRFPSLRIDVARKIIELDGRVCLQRGLIEVLGCTPYGKKHESILELDCRPQHLMAACLLLGMQEARGQVHALGDGGALAGDRALVLVSWQGEDGAEVTRRAEDLLLDAHDGTTMSRVGWAFTGSRFVKVAGRQQFASNASGQMITTFHDPDAILDNPLEKGADDTTYYANSHALPPPGTPVILRVVRATRDGTAALDPRALEPAHIPPVAPDPAGDPGDGK